MTTKPAEKAPATTFIPVFHSVQETPTFGGSGLVGMIRCNLQGQAQKVRSRTGVRIVFANCQAAVDGGSSTSCVAANLSPIDEEIFFRIAPLADTGGGERALRTDQLQAIDERRTW